MWIRRRLRRLDETLRRAPPGLLFWLVVCVNLALILAVVATPFLPSQARLSLRAETEALRVVLPAGSEAFAWGALPYRPSLRAKPPCPGAQLDLSTRVVGPVTMTARKSAGGPLVVTLLADDGRDLASVTCPSGGTFKSGPRARFEWAAVDAQNVALSFVGQVTAGEGLLDGTPGLRMLHAGKIYVEAPSFPFGSTSIVTETELFPGDRVEFFHGAGAPAVAHGVIQINKDGLMDVTAHATAKEAQVLHIGQADAGTTSIAPTLWSKLQAQPEWTLAIAVGALCLNILSALQHYMETARNPTRRRAAR